MPTKAAPQPRPIIPWMGGKRRLAKRSNSVRLDAFESRADDFQHRVNNGYAALARDMVLPVVECIAPDHRKTPAEIQAEILQIVS